MKTLLICLLCTLSVPVVAQDSVLLYPKYFLSTRPGEIDPRMIGAPYAAYANTLDSERSYLQVLMKDATIYTPLVVFEECPGADSVAVYFKIEDTLVMALLHGKSQNVMYAESMQGPKAWGRRVYKLPKGTNIVALNLPPYGSTADDLNEQDARLYFGSVTAYYPAKAGVTESGSTRTIGADAAHHAEYYDLLGRTRGKGRVMKRMSDDKFLVIR